MYLSVYPCKSPSLERLSSTSILVSFFKNPFTNSIAKSFARRDKISFLSLYRIAYSIIILIRLCPVSPGIRKYMYSHRTDFPYEIYCIIKSFFCLSRKPYHYISSYTDIRHLRPQLINYIYILSFCIRPVHTFQYGVVPALKRHMQMLAHLWLHLNLIYQILIYVLRLYRTQPQAPISVYLAYLLDQSRKA